MIGPFWCEEKKCWVRFTVNTERFIAEVAAQNADDKTLSLDWTLATEDYWQVQYQENKEQRLDQSFILLKGQLYRTDFKKHPHTQLINITTYKLNEQSIGFRLNKNNNPFENKSLQTIADISFNQLPLTPELIRERQAAQENERASSWEQWKNSHIGKRLNLTELSTFTPEESEALLNTLLEKLPALTAAQYSTPELYQDALKKAISDTNDRNHQIVQNFSIAADETPTGYFYATEEEEEALLNEPEIKERRKAFAFAILSEELNQLNKAFHLVPPEAPANDDTSTPLPPVSSGSTNPGPSESSEMTVPVDQAKPKTSLNPPAPIATSIPSQNPPAATTHINAIAEAVKKYQEWYKTGKTHRGANGWFSWLRHGEKGQNRANVFLEEIKKCTTAGEAKQKINDFLKHPDTRYHRHSLSSFILDELISNKLHPWGTLKQNPQGLYDQKKIADALGSPEPTPGTAKTN